MASTLPRGVRNCNPGNVRHGDPWQGLTETQLDPDFCSFSANYWGFRAIASILVTYEDRYKITNIGQAIARWAPGSDNNDTAAYIASVVKNTGFTPDEMLDFHQYADVYKVIRAITIQECGSFDQYFKKWELDEGLKRAGIQGVPRGTAAAVVRSAATIGAAGTTYAASNPDQVASVVNTIKPIVEATHHHAIQLGFGWAAGILCGAVMVGELVRILRRS